MIQKKILIVDDEPVICEILAFNLADEGYEVTCAHSAEETLRKLLPDHSLLLLDVMMGGMSGYKLTEQLRRKNNRIPVIFLTAKNTENDMLTGFSVGADDYIAKPFSIKEVLARVKAVLKRYGAPKGKPAGRIFLGDGVMIDHELKELVLGDRRILLTKTEFELIALLSGQPKHIFSREEIIDCIWKETPYITARTIDVHITRLRKKLGDRASLLSNRAGFGYRFNTAYL
ncbi:MAG: response regulator transcription factor [Tannerella sp.]|jgi:DNA-binding response OmpR family regulator|nr:response regulator transcription factor [Tannerella sp.]